MVSSDRQQLLMQLLNKIKNLLEPVWTVNGQEVTPVSVLHLDASVCDI